MGLRLVLKETPIDYLRVVNDKVSALNRSCHLHDLRAAKRSARELAEAANYLIEELIEEIYLSARKK